MKSTRDLRLFTLLKEMGLDPTNKELISFLKNEDIKMILAIIFYTENIDEKMKEQIDKILNLVDQVKIFFSNFNSPLKKKFFQVKKIFIPKAFKESLIKIQNEKELCENIKSLSSYLKGEFSFFDNRFSKSMLFYK